MVNWEIFSSKSDLLKICNFCLDLVVVFRVPRGQGKLEKNQGIFFGVESQGK